MAEDTKKIITLRRFGENKEEVSEKEYETFKRKFRFTVQSEQEICSTGYVVLKKSLENIAEEMKKTSNDQIVEEEIYEEVKTTGNVQSMSGKEEENEESLYEEVKEIKKMLEDDFYRDCKPEEVKYEEVLGTDDHIYSNVDEEKNEEIYTKWHDEIIYENVPRIKIKIPENKCLKCKSHKVTSEKSKNLLKETKTLLKAYRSKVMQLEKENKNATTSLNAICIELENKKSSVFSSKLSTLFRKKKSETNYATPSMSDQIKIISDYIQKIQKKQEVTQKKLQEAQEEIKNLNRKPKLNTKERVTKKDFSEQVGEDTTNIKNFEETNSADLKIQLEEMQSQINEIMKIYVSKAEIYSKDNKFNEKISEKIEERLEEPLGKGFCDKKEILDNI